MKQAPVPVPSQPSRSPSSAVACFYLGQVMHDRLRPVRNRFVYPVFFVRLRVDALDQVRRTWFGVDRWSVLSIRRRDYGPRDGSSLVAWIQGRLEQAGIKADGEIWLQTFPRLFGFAFNPVSFWYCQAKNGQTVAVLAEVNNTFGERHCYLLDLSRRAEPVAHCSKNFHVSPFLKVEGHYRFRFRESGTRNFVGIDYYDDAGLLLKTSISGCQQEFSWGPVSRALLTQPLMTLGIVARIHWQALRLWWRRVPVFAKPSPPALSITHSSTNEASR